MKYFFIIFLQLSLQSLIAQSNTKLTENKKDSSKSVAVKEYTILCVTVDIKAQVKNPKHWQNYLAENLKLIPSEQDSIPDGTYQIIATFIVDKEGLISNIRVLNDPGYGLGNKVIAVISRFKEK